MKRFMLFLLCLSLTTVALAEQDQEATKKPKQEEKKEEKDSAPLIVGYLLQSIIPNLLNAIAAKEADDTEEIIHSVGNAVQGIGTLTLALSKALKRDPDLTAEKCLLAYLRSNQGKLFLSKHKTSL